jgi:Icc-related predicted phosphoesterase
MRLQIFSDLHADVARPRPIAVAPEIDAVIVAGDVCEGAEKGFARLRQIVPMQVPIIMVMGNHEYYRRHLASELASPRQAPPLYGVHLLENEVVVLSGVRIIGCSLWTDYALFGDSQRAMLVAAHGLNDHRRIKWSKQPWSRFRPQEAWRLHQQSRAFIEATMAAPVDGATMVVTHHAPHPGSIHSQFKSDLLTAAYVSDLTTLIETGRPSLWVHGHVHESFDYRVGATRVVCNPHSYGTENGRFDPALVVEVAS